MVLLWLFVIMKWPWQLWRLGRLFVFHEKGAKGKRIIVRDTN